MALSQSEKQKRYRQRLKEKQRVAADLATAFLSTRFVDFLADDRAQQDLRFVDEMLDCVGLNMRTPLEQDVDPDWREEWGTPNRGALGRAERMAEVLIDIAKALAELINRYKLAEVEAALADLENEKLGTKEAKKAAFEKAALLTAIRARLTREVRHGFRPITVKEENA